MKMRKLLPVLVLIVGAALALTSCDAMLDALFPQNQIYVDVQVDMIAHPDWHLRQVTLGLYKDLSLESEATGYYSSADYAQYIAHYYFTFNNLADADYSVLAAIDGVSPADNNFWIFDPRDGSTVITSVTLPYINPNDSTGHSVTLITWLF